MLHLCMFIERQSFKKDSQLNLNSKPGAALDGLQIFLEGRVSGDLVGAGSGYDATVFKGVLHRTQTVADSILKAAVSID